MGKAPQTLLTLSDQPLPVLSSISLLPCSLAFDGPAPISTYFHPRPFTSEGTPTSSSATGEVPKHRQAAFRGRRLVSTLLNLPQGYKGLVFSTKAAVPPTSHRDLEEEEELQRKDEARRAREERMAKRAKLPNDSNGEGGEQSKASADIRRSPRKAAKEARERAVKAAKAKATASKGKAKQGWSLDDEDDDDDEREEEVTAAMAAEENKMDIEVDLSIATTTTTGKTVSEMAEVDDNITLPGPPVLGSVAATAVKIGATEASSDLVEDSGSSSTALPPPVPLLTRTSTSSSTLLHVPSTPMPSSTLSTQSSYTSFDDAPLARDEKHLDPVSTFTQIEVWNPDFPIAGARVAEEDEVARTVTEWIEIANKLHDY